VNSMSAVQCCAHHGPSVAKGEFTTEVLLDAHTSGFSAGSCVSGKEKAALKVRRTFC